MKLWNEGRMDAVLALLHPEIEWLEPPEQPDRAVVVGREQALGALMMWLSTWSKYGNEIRAMTVHGERVLVEMWQRMVGKESDVALEGKLFQVWTTADGLVTRVEMFFDREQAERVVTAP